MLEAVRSEATSGRLLVKVVGDMGEERSDELRVSDRQYAFALLQPSPSFFSSVGSSSSLSAFCASKSRRRFGFIPCNVRSERGKCCKLQSEVMYSPFSPHLVMLHVIITALDLDFTQIVLRGEGRRECC